MPECHGPDWAGAPEAAAYLAGVSWATSALHRRPGATAVAGNRDCRAHTRSAATPMNREIMARATSSGIRRWTWPRGWELGGACPSLALRLR